MTPALAGPKETPMCYPITCDTCGKITWDGCGQHADAVMADVARDQRCTCN